MPNLELDCEKVEVTPANGRYDVKVAMKSVDISDLSKQTAEMAEHLDAVVLAELIGAEILAVMDLDDIITAIKHRGEEAEVIGTLKG